MNTCVHCGEELYTIKACATKDCRGMGKIESGPALKKDPSLFDSMLNYVTSDRDLLGVVVAFISFPLFLFFLCTILRLAFKFVGVGMNADGAIGLVITCAIASLIMSPILGIKVALAKRKS